MISSRAIQKRIPDAEFLYVGTKDGLEADIVPKEGIAFETVNIRGFKRSLTPENFLRGAQAFGDRQPDPRRPPRHHRSKMILRFHFSLHASTLCRRMREWRT